MSKQQQASSSNNNTTNTSSSSIPSSIQALLHGLISKHKRGEISGSYVSSITTCELIRTYISKYKYNNNHTISELLLYINNIGNELQLSNLTELSITNIIKRVVQIIKNELITMNNQNNNISIQQLQQSNNTQL